MDFKYTITRKETIYVNLLYFSTLNHIDYLPKKLYKYQIN